MRDEIIAYRFVILEIRKESIMKFRKRNDIKELIDIPNVGPATIKCLNRLGIHKPAKLIGQNPYSMFAQLCQVTGKQFDPCLADIFISAVRFMEGAPARKWWDYTKERKATLSHDTEVGGRKS